ncbi:UPF0061 protein YdiU [Elysia marginata]|uniref:Selenoprotein O n=1 Tax=Elysia marginata TaxID=1093978 RepID=A0AAV4GUF4_9GAST|nr:UPF0061 protein YdiU [Elysia marginata]
MYAFCSHSSIRSLKQVQCEEKWKVTHHSDQCFTDKTRWDKLINPCDTLFHSFLGWLPFLKQRYISIFPIDSNKFNIVKNVQDVLFSVVKPIPFNSEIVLVAISHDVLVECLNLIPSVEESPVFIKFISGHQSPSFPPALAHRYGGHQFGYWSGQLGDGRAALLGTFINEDENGMELNLKGSGVTPYSRQGDGRSVLRSSVRVPTSRALSLVLSKDTVIRDEFYNGNMKAERGAMVVRIAPSWFRIGSLEILAFNEEIRQLKSLLDYLIEHHFRHINGDHKDRYLMLFDEIVNGTAHLISAWQSFGFTHGVCNTDNFSLLSITIDYGPFGFLEEYNLDFVPNTSDDEGRYSYTKQPSVGYYNLDKLRVALNPVLTYDQQETAKIILDGYYDIFNRSLLQRFTQKLGLSLPASAADAKLVAMFLSLMQQTRSDFTLSFRQLGETKLDDLLGGAIEHSQWALTRLKCHPKFDLFLDKYQMRLEEQGISDSDRRREMCKVNPVYVLRTWMAYNAIQRAEENDFSEVKKLQRVLSSPFNRQAEAENAGYSSTPPPWAPSIKVSCSS